jgi:ketosteroid isomerase-like protein
VGQAREIMDRITTAAMAGDAAALGQLYAADAAAETPDGGRLDGREAIIEFLLSFRRAFPDVSWESRATYDSGDTAIDEGFLVGTHTEVLSTPRGDVPPTGRPLRLRDIDLITVKDGVAVAHRFYYDSLDFMSQLGLAEPAAGAAAVPTQRVGDDRASQESLH